MQHLIGWFVKSVSFIFWILPFQVRWAMGCILAWLWYDVLRLRRYTVLKNICIVFPDMPKQEKIKLARKSMRLLGYTFPEFMTLPMLDKQFIEENVIFEGLEYYHKALEKKKGVLLLSMHLGSGDMGITAMALKGLKVNLISKKFHREWLNRIWFGIREGKGVRFIDAHAKNNAFEILAALRRNESVVFVLDQYMASPFGIETLFFGRKTGTAYGLALFAIKTQAPVLPVYTYRDDQVRTHVVFGPELELIPHENRDLQIQLLTQKYNDTIEHYVKQHPENWMWVHRRWKKWR